VVVRPLAVAVASAGSKLGRNDRLFLASLAPRGVVAAAVASLFGLQLAEQGVADAELLAPLTFFVIIGTATISGLAALPLARRLGIANENPQETLVVGGGPVAVEVARGIQRLGSDVTLAPGEDQEYEGVNVYPGHLLDDLDEIDLDLERFGNVLIVSPVDEYNSVVATQMSEKLGRKRVFQLKVEEGGGPAQPARRGRPLFEAGITYEVLARRIEETGEGLLENWEKESGQALLLPGEGEDDDAVLARWVEGQELAVTANDEHEAGEVEGSQGQRAWVALRSAAATVLEALTSFGRGRS
jgi:hypothetical protein